MKTNVSRISLIAAMAGMATPIAAHPGHLIETAGHSHWGALIALGGAIAVGIWAAKGKKKPESEAVEAEEDDVSEEELQEA